MSHPRCDTCKKTQGQLRTLALLLVIMGGWNGSDFHGCNCGRIEATIKEEVGYSGSIGVHEFSMMFWWLIVSSCQVGFDSFGITKDVANAWLGSVEFSWRVGTKIPDRRGGSGALETYLCLASR